MPPDSATLYSKTTILPELEWDVKLYYTVLYSPFELCPGIPQTHPKLVPVHNRMYFAAETLLNLIRFQFAI